MTLPLDPPSVPAPGPARAAPVSSEDPPMRPPVSKPWPSGLEFYGMREYVPGDDLRHVHWRSSAKADTLLADLDDECL